MGLCCADFGTQINGHIIDSAFTLAFDPRYNPLLQAVQEATNAGPPHTGYRLLLTDLGMLEHVRARSCAQTVCLAGFGAFKTLAARTSCWYMWCRLRTLPSAELCSRWLVKCLLPQEADRSAREP